MQFPRMIFDLCMHKYRKTQYFNALLDSISHDIIGDNTAYLYIDMWGHHGHAYARVQLRTAVIDCVTQLFKGSLLYKEDGSNDYMLKELLLHVSLKVDNLSYVKTSTSGKDIHLFTDNRYYPVQHVLVLSGDTVHNQLDKNPAVRFNWSDNLFDLLGRIADTESPTRLFADSSRMLNVFKVNKDGLKKSYSDKLSPV